MKQVKIKKIVKDPFIIFGSISIITVIVLVFVLFGQLKPSDNSGNVDVNTNIGLGDETTSVVDYTLRDSATDYQKEIYDELLTTHQAFEKDWTPETEVDYATALIKNFVADFYTWSNKDGRNDVGGLQYVYPFYRNDFRAKAVDVFYLYLDHYIEEYGAEQLLTVTNVDVTGVDPNFVYTMPDGTQMDATYVYVQWTYETSSSLDVSKFPNETGFVLVEKERQLVLIEIQ
ncbi:MAG: hypothetical protein ACRCS6_00355 [Turicibacter sp.]